MSEWTEPGGRFRWLGPTPEMLMWWNHGPCPLLDWFAEAFPMPTSAAAAYQALRPLKEIAAAHSENRLDGNLVYLLPQSPTPGATRQQTLSFFVDEVTQSFGGVKHAESACRVCPYNSTKQGSLAGCVGFVIAGDLDRLSLQTRELESHDLPLPVPQWEAEATVPPAWDRLMRRYLPESNANSGWYDLVQTITANPELKLHSLDPADVPAPLQALEGAMRKLVDSPESHRLRLEHIPRGFSDGHHWWLGPHCSRCHFPLSENSYSCPQCHHDSFPVPTARRRVMGWNPYWPLSALVAPETARQLTTRWSETMP